MADPKAMQPCLTMLSACSWLDIAAAVKIEQKHHSGRFST
jgi:hypothetical protein